MLQFKSANGSRASRRWAKSGKAEHISKEMSSLKVYRASRWSAIGLIGDPRPKTVLDDGRLSHGSVYRRHWVDRRPLGKRCVLAARTPLPAPRYRTISVAGSAGPSAGCWGSNVQETELFAFPKQNIASLDGALVEADSARKRLQIS